VDAAMPAVFARLHPRYRTPHVALIVQAVATTVLFLVSAFLSIGGGQTSVQEAYDIMVNLTILVYFVPYLYVFAAFIKLRRLETATPIGGMWVISGCGLAATLISIGLVFVPPFGTENWLNYEVNVIGQAALLLAIGMTLYYASRRR
jgi:amino acid transporter